MAKSRITPAKEISTVTDPKYFTLSKAEEFKETFETYIGVDEKSAIRKMTLTATKIPAGYVVTDVHLEFDLKELPDQVTIGGNGSNERSGKQTAWYQLYPTVPKQKLTSDKKLIGTGSFTNTLEFELEIKTGVFAGLEKESDPQIKYSKEDVFTKPNLDSAKPSAWTLKPRVLCTKRRITPETDVVEDTDETFTFVIKD